MRTKQQYHTGLVILFQAGILPDHILRTIPRSTRHSFKNRDMSRLIGTEHARLIDEQCELLQMLFRYEKLLQAVKVLLQIFRLYETTLLSFKSGKKRLLENRPQLFHICQYAKDKMPVEMLAGLLNTSTSFVKNLMLQPCLHSPFGLCKRIFPGQLHLSEIKVIKDYLTDHRFMHWPVSSVYYQILRDARAFFSLSTMYKYARKLGIKRSKQPQRKDRNKSGIRASRPMEILHMDFTMIRMLDNAKLYLHFIVDNFSRKILAYAASLKPDAKTAAENLRMILQQYSIEIPPVVVISDDGSENKGATAEVFAENNDLLLHKIAQRDIIFSNSMVESVNKSMKYYHLFPKDFSHVKHALAEVPDCVASYNNRPLHALRGLTANEAFEQAVTGKGMFAQQIAASKIVRKAKNKSKSCRDPEPC